MTAIWVILGCMAFVLTAGAMRGRPGIAVADTWLLFVLMSLIGIADLVLSQFMDTGRIGWTVAGLLAFGFALDALYGLMAPERQQRRDRKLRALMQRRRA